MATITKARLDAFEADAAKLEKLLKARRRVATIKAQMQITQDTYDRRMTLHEQDLVQAERELDKLCLEVMA